MNYRGSETWELGGRGWCPKRVAGQNSHKGFIFETVLISLLYQSFVVYAATLTEKREWMLHIERCIQDLLKEGRVPPSDYAALWVPDREAVKCQCCQTSHFTVIQRRHHCRACGRGKEKHLKISLTFQWFVVAVLPNHLYCRASAKSQFAFVTRWKKIKICENEILVLQ